MMVLKKIIILVGIFILIAGYVSASVVSYYGYRQRSDDMKNDLLLLNTKIKELELESERLDRLKRAMMPRIVAEAERQSETSFQPNAISGFASASTTALSSPAQPTSSNPPKKAVKVIRRVVSRPTQNQEAAQPEPTPDPTPQPDPTPADPDPVTGGAS